MIQINKLIFTAAIAVRVHLRALTSLRKSVQVPMTEAGKRPQTVPHRKRHFFCQKVHTSKVNDSGCPRSADLTLRFTLVLLREFS